jgi:hypothetical protein
MVRPRQIVPLLEPVGEKEFAEAPAAPAGPAPHLTDHGGPKLTAVQVHTVFWGHAWTQPPVSGLTGQLNGFFDYILTSRHMDILAEYGVGHGHRTGTITVVDPEPGANFAPEKQLPGVATSVGPALAVFGDRLYAAWKGMNDDQAIYWSRFNGTKWSAQKQMAGGTSVGPALAVFGNRLYAAWKGMNDDQAIYWSRFNGTKWSAQKQMAGGTSVGPALAVFGNRLYAAWKGMNDDRRIYWSSFDGTQWATQQRMAGVATGYGPALAVFGNRLYAAWKGAGSNGGICWSSFDGTRWATQQRMAGVATGHGPALAVFGNRLYAAWKGAGSNGGIYWSGFDGTSWSAQRQVPLVAAGVRPALAGFRNHLYMTWKGAGHNQNIYWSSLDSTAASRPRSITDPEIQQVLSSWIASGIVPRPNANTLYFLYLPPDVTVTMGTDSSCAQFCGYHNHINRRIFYAVEPYITCGGCTFGQVIDSLTKVSSHELCEAVTDPALNAWWDSSTRNEIGDICNSDTGKVGGYTIQAEWSNAANACVLQPGAGPAPPTATP